LRRHLGPELYLRHRDERLAIRAIVAMCRLRRQRALRSADLNNSRDFGHGQTASTEQSRGEEAEGRQTGSTGNARISAAIASAVWRKRNQR
jgi:hypothetical protein